MLSAIRYGIFLHTTVSCEFNWIYHAEFWAAAAPLAPPHTGPYTYCEFQPSHGLLSGAETAASHSAL